MSSLIRYCDLQRVNELASSPAPPRSKWRSSAAASVQWGWRAPVHLERITLGRPLAAAYRQLAPGGGCCQRSPMSCDWRPHVRTAPVRLHERLWSSSPAAGSPTCAMPYHGPETGAALPQREHHSTITGTSTMWIRPHRPESGMLASLRSGSRAEPCRQFSGTRAVVLHLNTLRRGPVADLDGIQSAVGVLRPPRADRRAAPQRAGRESSLHDQPESCWHLGRKIGRQPATHTCVSRFEDSS
jgi:hypothetical protein